MQRFIHYLQQFVDLSRAELDFLSSQLSVRRFAKGTVLLMEGQVASHFYFNISGCCRMYYLVDGLEKNAFFYTENQFISAYQSFVYQLPSKHYLACIEDCELVAISAEDAQLLLAYSSSFEQLSRIFLEQELMLYQQVLSSFITQNAEERYRSLSEVRPALAQRIPQYQLASYLGVSPETLSRIRKRLAKKGVGE